MNKETSKRPPICKSLEKRATLPKSQRLKTPADFRRVYSSKQWGNSSYFTFNVSAIAVSDAAAAESVLGITVSKKVSKRAVDRNRIKRQVKEFYRQRKSALKNAELVITAKPGCAEASDEERQQNLLLLWEKILKWQRWHLMKSGKIDHQRN